MNVRMDKRLIELMNQQGAGVTWEQFRAAYTVRQEERYNDPKAVALRARELQRLDAELEYHRKAMHGQ